MNNRDHFPSVRLAVAGYASVFLLAWIAFVPGTFLSGIPLYGTTNPLLIVATGGIAGFIVVILVPVFWHGPWTLRLLALLVSFFPALIFGATSLWFASQLFSF